MNLLNRTGSPNSWPRLAVTLLIALLAAAPVHAAASRTIVKKGPHFYYLHPSAGLIQLSAALQIQSVVSLPGGTPVELDVDSVSGNVFVACKGGVALVRSGANHAEWFEDSFTTYTSMGGSTVTNHYGFDHVAVADGHLAFFSHPCDESMFSDMRGMVVTLPTQGGALKEVTAEPAYCSDRSRFHDLVYIPDTGNVVSVAYGAKYRLFDGTQGTQLLDWSGLNTFAGGTVWDTSLYVTNGEYYVGASLLKYEEDPRNLPLDATLIFAPGKPGLEHTPANFLPAQGSARSLRFHQGTYFASHIKDDASHTRGGISAFDASQNGYFIETDPPPVGSANGVSFITVAGDMVYGSCDFGVLGVTATGIPAKKFYTTTPGQGPLFDLGDGTAAGPGRASTRSSDGSYSIYIVHATPSGAEVVDLSDACLRLDQVLPPIVSADTLAPIELRGARMTPDCAVYFDITMQGRRMLANDDTEDMTDHRLTSVQYGGIGSLTASVRPLEFGPIDVVIQNNGGRQWAVRTNAVVIERPPITVQKGDWLIVDSEADPYHFAKAGSRKAPGAIFRVNQAQNRLDVVSMALDMPDPMDLIWDPVSQGHYLTVSGYGLSEINGGSSGVFALNLTNGFFSTWRNLVASHADFSSGEQLLLLPDGRMLCLDSTAYLRDGTNVTSDGIIYEILRTGETRVFSTSPFWKEPRTMDLGPDGRIYACDPGDSLFGGGTNPKIPALHAIDPDTGRADVVFRSSLLGFALDAAFAPDGHLRILSMLGSPELDHVELLDVDPEAAPEQAIHTLLDSRTSVMPMCLAYLDSDLYLVGVTTDSGTWGLYRFAPLDPSHPVLIQQLAGLVAPRRLVRAAMSPVAQRPRLLPAQREGNNLRLSWEPASTLKLQTCSNLTQPSWTDVSGSTGQSQATVSATNTAAFYRLIETQSP